MVVAIDGPAGAGKSSVARAVAARLGYTYLDTGAMYRCVGLAARTRNRPPGEVASGLELEVGERVLLDGCDVTKAIRTPQAGEDASRAAADPAVRAALVAKQRALLADGNWVVEGRDIATVVAPGAEVRVFLTAAPEERARRRAAELGEDPEAVLADLRERDERDVGQGRSTLAAAPGAIVLDTTGRSLDEVVDEIAALARHHRRS
jgi:cytidylate kinase